MKPLIILDFSHTASRMLHTAVYNINPKKKDGKFISAEYIPYMKHLVFNSLQYIKNNFQGELVIAMDSRNNWRKDLYPDYKAHRVKNRKESEINFDDYYKAVEELGEALDKYFPFKVLKIEKAEADDIAGVLSSTFGNDRKVTLITSDHDWSQVLAENSLVNMYDPIKREYQTMDLMMKTPIDTIAGKMSRFSIIHALIGDSGDNVLSITDNTEFSDNFKSYLKEHEIYTDSVKEFLTFSVSQELMDKFNIYKTVKSGKKKGQSTGIKDIYKKVPFGIKRAEKAALSSATLNQLLSKHNMYKERFKLNSTLVDFEKIPEDIKDKILKDYNNTEVHYDPNGILKYFINENLEQMVGSVNKFYDSSYEIKNSSSLDDFF